MCVDLIRACHNTIRTHPSQPIISHNLSSLTTYRTVCIASDQNSSVWGYCGRVATQQEGVGWTAVTQQRSVGGTILGAVGQIVCCVVCVKALASKVPVTLHISSCSELLY